MLCSDVGGRDGLSRAVRTHDGLATASTSAEDVAKADCDSLDSA